MNAETAPMLPEKKLTALYSIALEQKIKARLHYLKETKRVNVPELIRQKIDEILASFDLRD